MYTACAAPIFLHQDGLVFILTDQKQILRQEALKHRSRMYQDMEDPDAAKELFLKSIQPEQNQIVAGYWPKDKEFDAVPILEHFIGQGIQCALPVVEKGSRVLKFARWNNETQMRTGVYNIPEPVTKSDQDFVLPDIVIVPLLAFDRRGYRLGYGGGYYDATLKALREEKQIVAVGIAYAQQACLFNLPVEDHDEALDWVITPKGTHYFAEH